MNYYISESQLKLIVEDNNTKKIASYTNNLKNFSKKVIKDLKTKYNIDVKMLLTWSTTVSGFMMPLDNYIRSGDFKLSDEQISLIIVGVSSILLYETEDFFEKISKILKDDGILSTFKKVLQKGKLLKKSFISFLESLNVTVKNTLDIINYSVLIPIMTDIQEIAVNTSNIETTSKLICKRLLSSIVISISSESFYLLIHKILINFKKSK